LCLIVPSGVPIPEHFICLPGIFATAKLAENFVFTKYFCNFASLFTIKVRSDESVPAPAGLQGVCFCAKSVHCGLVPHMFNLFNYSQTMHLSSEEKKKIFETYGTGANDTGSPESQIALFSVRIKHLTEHLKSNHKDYTTARALKALVGQRRSLLDYLIRKDINRYRAIIAKKELGIRK